MAQPSLSAKISPAPEPDAVLLSRAAHGDARAFGLIYRRYARYVAAVAYRLMGDDLDVDDVVQDTFVDAAAGLSGLRDPATLKGWLATIATRKVARKLARRRRQRWLSRWLGFSEPTHAAPGTDGACYALYLALSTLDPRQRIPWTLHEIEGMTLPEVAEACGASLATIKRRIAKANEQLALRGYVKGGGGEH